MQLAEVKQQHKLALDTAERFISQATSENRPLTGAEQAEYSAAMGRVGELSREIKGRESQSTIRGMMRNGMLIMDGGRQTMHAPTNLPLSADYANDFFSYIASAGSKVGAALYEGSDGAGGYTVPIRVDQNVVPLAPPDQGVRQIALVIPTVMDVKLPRKGAFGVAGAKAESGASSNSFPETDPTLEQFTLSAFMAGIRETVSWELAQDVPNFQAFAVEDMLSAQQIYEGNKYVNGSGTNEPQGLIGNTGAGITGVGASTSDNYASELLDATFDVTGVLKTPYHANASWLMQRSTATVLRKAQKQANLFEPVFVRSGGQDYLHGYPVTYDSNMPTIAASATPVLFGDFKQGYVIGDRGGAGINVKVLDQVQAIQGQLVLLAYRRSDGRVRRSEAIQAITLHS